MHPSNHPTVRLASVERSIAGAGQDGNIAAAGAGSSAAAAAAARDRSLSGGRIPSVPPIGSLTLSGVPPVRSAAAAAAAALSHAPSYAYGGSSRLTAAQHKSALERERERERERDRERDRERTSARRNAQSDSEHSSASESAPYTTGVPLRTKRKLRKNNREKQRRSELNEKFDELCELLRLTSTHGSSGKVEKCAILAEAYVVIQALRKESVDQRAEKAELKAEVAKLSALVAQQAATIAAAAAAGHATQNATVGGAAAVAGGSTGSGSHFSMPSLSPKGNGFPGFSFPLPNMFAGIGGGAGGHAASTGGGHGVTAVAHAVQAHAVPALTFGSSAAPTQAFVHHQQHMSPSGGANGMASGFATAQQVRETNTAAAAAAMGKQPQHQPGKRLTHSRPQLHSPAPFGSGSGASLFGSGGGSALFGSGSGPPPALAASLPYGGLFGSGGGSMLFPTAMQSPQQQQQQQQPAQTQQQAQQAPQPPSQPRGPPPPPPSHLRVSPSHGFTDPFAPTTSFAAAAPSHAFQPMPVAASALHHANVVRRSSASFPLPQPSSTSSTSSHPAPIHMSRPSFSSAGGLGLGLGLDSSLASLPQYHHHGSVSLSHMRSDVEGDSGMEGGRMSPPLPVGHAGRGGVGDLFSHMDEEEQHFVFT